MLAKIKDDANEARVYCRVSTERQGQSGLGLESQINKDIENE